MESDLSESLPGSDSISARVEPNPWPSALANFQPPKTTFFYRFSLMAVATVMVLLLAVYAALLGGVLLASILFGIAYSSELFARKFGVAGVFLGTIRFLVCAGPGCLLALFLVKPVFAPKAEAGRAFSLNHADAPRLFALAGWICRTVNAPIPSRIDVNLTPNAGAAFRNGWRSVFGNDIVLVIGLPLVAGLNCGQFAGVLAHEFGHFSQGAALRASCLIRQINGWFFSVVCLRDGWDRWLVRVSEGENGRLLFACAAWLARFGVWLGRAVLWPLMLAAQALSCLLQRQMEFDADAYEYKLSGSDAFISTSRRARQLNLGVEAAERRIMAKWKTDRKLFDQVPEFIVACANEISAETQAKHFSQTLSRRTRWFDTHPGDAERMQRARAANEPGFVHDDAPATTLFADFAELSRRVTIGHYHQLIGPEFSEAWLVSTEQTARQAAHDYSADEQAMRRYFHGAATCLRPVIIEENKSPLFRGRQALTAEIRSCRERMDQLAESARDAHRMLLDADNRILNAVKAGELLKAGFAFDPDDFDLADADPDAALADARGAFDNAARDVTDFAEAGRTRLTNAIQLLRLPDFEATIPRAAQHAEASREFVFALSRLGNVFPPLLELRRDCAALEAILHCRREGERGDHLTASLDRLTGRARRHISEIQQGTCQIRYPFRHATEHLLVSEYARNKEFCADPYESVLREGLSHTEKLFALYHRLLGGLIEIAEEVEGRMVGDR